MNQNIYEKQLIEAGLTKDQAMIYEILLQYGNVQAGRLALLSGLKRPLVYKILEQLLEIDLIEKEEKDNKVARFLPKHPEKLRELVEGRIKEIKIAENSIDSVIGDMVSKFNLISGKPNVQFYEGEKGLQKLYDDIISTKKDIMLLRSPLDESNPKLKELVSKQIERQVTNKIQARVITPLPNTGDGAEIDKDEMRRVTRRIVPLEHFDIPAQIVLYGGKVGITSYNNGLFTTIIDNPDIRKTMEKVFEFIWDKAK